MKPLSGQRVIDVTQTVAGPYCTQVLADLGAEIFKMSAPAPVTIPGIGRRRSVTACLPRMPPSTGGKRSVALDLDHPEGQKLLRRLLKPDDILMHSLKPGSAEQRGRGTPS